jgi:hypothetical protein
VWINHPDRNIPRSGSRSRSKHVRVGEPFNFKDTLV